MTKFTGTKRSWPRKLPLAGRRMAVAAARDAGRAQAMGPRHWVMSIYSVVKDPRRGKRQGRDEPRAQEVGARVCGSVAASGIFGEARAPKSIIQEGKKGIRSLIIVFMEIQPVTGFVGEI